METEGGSQLFESAEKGGVMKNGPLKGGGSCKCVRDHVEVTSTEEKRKFFILDPLKTRREKHIVKLVKNCLDGLDGKAPSYFSDYFRR